mgnify:CR=1 FL=1
MTFDKTINSYVDKKILNAISEFVEGKNFVAAADVLAVAFGSDKSLFSKEVPDFEGKLISSFQKNLSLLVQKTWIEKSDAELKEHVLYQLNEYSAAVSKGQWNKSYAELLQIVTGAPNVKEGQIIPVALVGAKLPNGQKISKGKLRGVASVGMLCSAQELNLPLEGLPKEQTTGIYILPPDTPVGIYEKSFLNAFSAKFTDFGVSIHWNACLRCEAFAPQVH